MDYITDQEQRILDITGQLAVALRPLCSPGDWVEMVFHIHGIQNAILTNAAARVYPDKYRLLDGNFIK